MTDLQITPEQSILSALIACLHSFAQLSLQLFLFFHSSLFLTSRASFALSIFLPALPLAFSFPLRLLWLQENYYRLLTEYAEAKNTIDRLRLEAKVVNLEIRL